MPDTIKCESCLKSKPKSEYYFRYNLGKYDYYCKYCRVGSSLKSHKNRRKARLCTYEGCNKPHYAKSYCRQHYSRLLAHGTVERLTNLTTDDEWAYNLNYVYGLTPGVFKQMHKYGCNVCKIKVPYDGRRFQVDHDHVYTGKSPIPKKYIRGVVCHQCNTALGKYDNGLLRQDYDLYNKIEKYVRRYEKRQKR
jgi:hypothetical protein